MKSPSNRHLVAKSKSKRISSKGYSRSSIFLLCFFFYWTNETVVSVKPPSSRHILEEVVVSSEVAGATVNCLCSMWSRVFSMALNLFSRLVVPTIPTCNCGPSGNIANNHHVHDGPSGKRGQSSSVSGIRPNTRWISNCWDNDTVSHHLLPFVLTWE